MFLSGDWHKHYVYQVPGDLTQRVLTETGSALKLRVPGEGETFRDSGTVTYVPNQEYETPSDMHGVHDLPLIGYEWTITRISRKCALIGMGGRPSSFSRKAVVVDKSCSQRLLRVATARVMRSSDHLAVTLSLHADVEGCGTADSPDGGRLAYALSPVGSAEESH